MNLRLLSHLILLLLATSTGLPGNDASFGGEWQTEYGRMILKDAGGKIEGTYEWGGNVCGITGTQEGRKLTFTYTEPGETAPGASGHGEFELAPDGQRFEGKWGPTPESLNGKWSGHRVTAGERNFSGVWRTSYGMMRLIQTGEKVEGCYDFNGRATIKGTASYQSLNLTYREPDGTTGTAQWQLAPDRATFGGSWKPEKGPGGVWRGQRVEPEQGRVWLIILEARWEASLRDGEYSYGEMLRQFFTRVPKVAVRHRFFTGRTDFGQWCTDLPYFAEPIVFYISSHGTEKGIMVGREVLDGAFIGEQLRYAPTVKLIHLGACIAMSGAVPVEIRKASALPAPVSGYTRTADWAGSAVIDFAYLDLVLARQMPPGEAVTQIRQSVAFAKEEAPPRSAFPPAGLKILE